MRRAGDVALTLVVGIGIGLLIGYLLGFTHGSPTAENASPPPEAFDYPFGILVGLALATVGRFVVPPLQRSLRGRSRAEH